MKKYRLFLTLSVIALSLIACSSTGGKTIPGGSSSSDGGEEGEHSGGGSSSDGGEEGEHSGGSDPIIDDHVHTFDDKRWEYDDYNHWHPATCEHTSEKKDMEPHELGPWIVGQEATIYDDGYRYRACDKCPFVQRETIDKIKHQHVLGEPIETIVTEPTCWHDGEIKEEIYCTECGELVETNFYTIPSTEHTAGEPHIEGNDRATCERDGYYYITVRCEICGDIISREYVEEKAKGHDYQYLYTEPATYEWSGSIVYRCSRCGDYIYEEGDPQLEHHYSTEWSVDTSSYKHYHQCTDEGYSNLRIDEEYHQMTDNLIVDYEPTVTEPGRSYYECRVCHYREYYSTCSYEELYADKLGGSTNSKTNKYEITGILPYYVFDTDTLYLDPHNFRDNVASGIASDAFKGLTWFKRVIIGEGIEYISSGAFANCENLEEVILPDSLTSIADEVFKGCSKLNKIVLPDALTELGDNVFENPLACGKESDNGIYIPSKTNEHFYLVGVSDKTATKFVVHPDCAFTETGSLSGMTQLQYLKVNFTRRSRFSTSTNEKMTSNYIDHLFGVAYLETYQFYTGSGTFNPFNGEASYAFYGTISTGLYDYYQGKHYNLYTHVYGFYTPTSLKMIDLTDYSGSLFYKSAYHVGTIVLPRNLSTVSSSVYATADNFFVHGDYQESATDNKYCYYSDNYNENSKINKKLWRYVDGIPTWCGAAYAYNITVNFVRNDSTPTNLITGDESSSAFYVLFDTANGDFYDYKDIEVVVSSCGQELARTSNFDIPTAGNYHAALFTDMPFAYSYDIDVSLKTKPEGYDDYITQKAPTFTRTRSLGITFSYTSFSRSGDNLTLNYSLTDQYSKIDTTSSYYNFTRYYKISETGSKSGRSVNKYITAGSGNRSDYHAYFGENFSSTSYFEFYLHIYVKNFDGSTVNVVTTRMWIYPDGSYYYLH